MRPNGLVVAFEYLRTPTGDLYVTPSDAQDLVASGALDRELFNVRYLVENGYGDAARASLPVIVEYPERLSPTVEQQLAENLPASNVTHVLESIDATSLNVSKANAESFWGNLTGKQEAAKTTAALETGVTKVWLDRNVQVDLNESVPQIRAPEAWAAGYDGTGVKIAVLDTGIDESHPDVAGKVLVSRSFIPDQTVVDGHGHGTHVASIAAGTGAAQGGIYKGVAPGARLAIGKVCNNGGDCPGSSVVEGMEWAAEEQAADVVSMSLGACCTDGTDLLSQAVNDLTEQTGALFVIAAGNSGPNRETINTPGVADAALTIAAVDKSDQLAEFSSRGPRRGDSALKPDIAAPGVGIVAARAAGTSLGTPVDDHYTRASGTSMATPHVAGAAAILKQQHPGWDHDELKSALTGSTHSSGEVNPYQQGSGRLDVARAIEQSLLATPSNLDFGPIPDNAPPPTRTITVSNQGNGAQTFTLTAQLSDPAGDPTSDAITLSPSAVTIPAGGSAEVTATFDPGDGPFGTYGGLVRALDGDGAELLRLAVGANRQPPMHTVTLRSVPLPPDPTGAQPAFWRFLRVDAPQDPIELIHAGTDSMATVRVPEGVYWVSLTYSDVVDPQAGSGDGSYIFVDEPEFVVNGDRELFLDQRRARLVTALTPRPSDHYSRGLARVRGTSFGGEWASAGDVGPAGNRIYATPTRPVATGTFRVEAAIGLMEPPFTMRVLGKDPITVHTVYPDYRLRPRAELDRTVEVVDIGAGTAEEIEHARVRGRIALYGYDWLADEAPGYNRCLNATGPTITHPRPWQRLKEAGAIAAVAFLDVEGSRRFPLCGGPTPFTGPYSLALPVVTVGPVEGNLLQARARGGPVRVAVRAVADASYAYHLSFDEAERIPDTLTFRVRDRDLVTVDSRFHADAPALVRTGWENVALNATARLPGPLYSFAPSRRMDNFYPASRGVLWSARAEFDGSSAEFDGPYTENLEPVFARSGHRVEHWNASPRVPGVEPVLQSSRLQRCSACREENTFSPYMGLRTPGNSHDAGQLGLVDFNEDSGECRVSGEWHLYRNGQEIPFDAIPGIPLDDIPPEAIDACRATIGGTG